MEYKLIIIGKLPGLNEYTAANRTNPHKGGKMKKDAEEAVIWPIRQQLRGIHITQQVDMFYVYYEPNMKRDKDNISSFARKVIQDSLVKTGIIENDGWKNIRDFRDSFRVDSNYPRIEVTIQEVGD